MNVATLKDQIWTTRISRVNAERRLIRKENFIQAINIYYSCATIIFSILSILEHNKSQLGIVTTFMSICLLVVILYTNSQRYLDHARDYRTNYAALQKLEFKLERSDINEDEIEKIQMEYCDLIDCAWNHTQFDYYCTIYQSRGEYREKRWKFRVAVGFFWGKIWRAVVMFAISVLPIILYFLCGGI